VLVAYGDGEWPRRAASPAATRKSSSRRPCRLQVVITLSSYSADRLPALRSEWKEALTFRSRIIALVALARERGLDTVYVPAIGAREATLLGGVRAMPVPVLAELVAQPRDEAPITPAPEGEDLAPAKTSGPAATWPTWRARSTPAARWRWPRWLLDRWLPC
jgi:hypothetical protein